MPERGAGAEERDPRRPLEVTRGREDLAVDGPQVVAAQAPLDEQAEPRSKISDSRAGAKTAPPWVPLRRPTSRETSARWASSSTICSIEIVHPLAKV